MPLSASKVSDVNLIELDDQQSTAGSSVGETFLLEEDQGSVHTDTQSSSIGEQDLIMLIRIGNDALDHRGFTLRVPRIRLGPRNDFEVSQFATIVMEKGT